MQRTESELGERYFARLFGIEDRWSDKARQWVIGSRRERRIYKNVDHIALIQDILKYSDTLWAARKALGHWPRRES